MSKFFEILGVISLIYIIFGITTFLAMVIFSLVTGGAIVQKVESSENSIFGVWSIVMMWPLIIVSIKISEDK